MMLCTNCNQPLIEYGNTSWKCVGDNHCSISSYGDKVSYAIRFRNDTYLLYSTLYSGFTTSIIQRISHHYELSYLDKWVGLLTVPYIHIPIDDSFNETAEKVFRTLLAFA